MTAVDLEATKSDIVKNLPLKLRAVASPVANCAPNKCLGFNGPRALLARETAEEGSRGFSCMAVTIPAFFARSSNRSHRASARSPHPSLLRNDPSREGGSAGAGHTLSGIRT